MRIHRSYYQLTKSFSVVRLAIKVAEINLFLSVFEKLLEVLSIKNHT